MQDDLKDKEHHVDSELPETSTRVTPREALTPVDAADPACQVAPMLAPTFRLAQGDAVEWLRTLPAESVDLVITDPAYESLEKHRAVGTTTRLKHSKSSSNDWFVIFPNARFAELFAELYRVLKRNTHFYLFCDPETAFIAKPIGEAAGFKFWKPLVWDKKKIGMGYHYRARYEFILFFEKGKRKLHNLGIPDIIEVPRIHGGYPTEKPAAVSEVLISQSTERGTVVIDPFMGSGSVGCAAAKLGCSFWGNDIGAEATSITRGRLLELGAREEVNVPFETPARAAGTSKFTNQLPLQIGSRR
jgi:site-specific DNA-methyltransferase (adenine-specific)